MKLPNLLTACAALLAFWPTFAVAQTSAIPGFISYQGRVVDALGVNVGAGTPVNRTVIFRIWDNPSSTNTANLIYSEAQTVTVSEGEFSVLVGQGVANTTETFGYSEAAKKLADFSTVFSGSARYLGVTVAAAAAIATTDNEITPRQQIVSTPFAMRAKFAESISSSSDLTLTPLSGAASNYGLGWYGTGRLFGATAVDGPVLYGNAGGALGSNASGTYNTALRWDASGRVGVGIASTSITSTTNKLTVQGDMATSPADQLTIRGNADINKRLLLGYDTTANKASLQSYTAVSTAGPLLLNPSGGNVGIGTSSPNQALTVGPHPGDASSIVNIRSYTDTGTAWKGAGAFGGSNATVILGELGGIATIGGHSATLNAWRDFNINAGGGNVGIGTGIAAPTAKLDVAGDIKSNGKSVPVSDEANLKIIRGTVNASGVIVRGTGFTVTKVAGQTGLYQITFTSPFSSGPTVTTSITGRYGIKAEVYDAGRASFPVNNTDGLYPGLGGFTAGVTHVDSLTQYNFGFSFIAIGPR